MSEPSTPSISRSRKSDAAFRTISEVATELDVPQHVLRFWESKFTQVKPLKRGGGRRYYRPEDVTLLKRIRDLLYDDGLTIKGVQKLFRDRGVKSVIDPHADPIPKSSPTAPLSSQQDMTDSELATIIAEMKEMRLVLQKALAAR